MRNEKDIREIAAFFKKMYFPVKQWPWGSLLRWLRWYDAGSGLLVCRQGKRIRGIALCRTISDQEQGFNEYSFDAAGKIAWIQGIAAQNGDAFKSLGRQIKEVFKNCEKVAFSREKNRGNLKIYDINKIGNKIK